MKIKNLIIKNKKILIGIIIALAVGFIGGMGELPKDEYNVLLVEKENLDKEIAELDTAIENQQKDNNELEAKKTEKDRLAKVEKERVEAAEKEKARLEAERIANEAKRVKEEAERIAREQEINNAALVDAPGETPSNDYVDETPIGQMVWLSATGSKYHSKNDCGNMNPSTSRQVSIDEASQSYGACSKCF